MSAVHTANVRAIDQQVALHARDNGLSDEEAHELGGRLIEMHEWMLAFRTSVSKVRDHGEEHPFSQNAIDEQYARTRQYVDRFGSLSFRLKADRPITDEGISLPTGESELDYPMFAFYRDGVTRLTLLPGFGRGEVAALIGAIIQPLHGTGDDTVTYLWYARLRYLRVEVDGAFTPRNAVALHASHGADPVIASYVAAFAAAGPRFRGTDYRKPFTLADTHQLEPLGVTPAYAQAIFGAAKLDPWFQPPSQDRRDDFSVHAEDLHDREFRLVRIQQHATATPAADDV